MEVQHLVEPGVVFDDQTNQLLFEIEYTRIKYKKVLGQKQGYFILNSAILCLNDSSKFSEYQTIKSLELKSCKFVI